MAPAVEAAVEAFYTVEDVAAHSSKADCWVIVHDGVYDVTDFLAIHPGGAGVLAGLGGKDATDFFDELHRPEVLTEIAAEYKIGVIGEAPAGDSAPAGDGAETVSAEQWREVKAPTTAGKDQIISMAEVAQHKDYDDCWLVVDDKVYDVSKFMEDHPGGPKPLVLYGGKDATEEFTMIHHPDIIKAYGELYRIGILEGTETAAAMSAAEVPAEPASTGVDGGFYTVEEVAQHSTKDDCWVIVHDGVYDVTDFLAIHPGGAGVLAGLGGKDATDFFDELHRPEVLTEIAAEYKIGVIGEAPAGDSAPAGDGAETVSAEQWREVKAPTTAGKDQIISMAEVAQHKDYDDCWLVVDGKVYDVSKFMEDHPGGPKPLVLYGGKDATEEFTMIHHPDIIKAYGELYRIGILEGTETAAAMSAAEVPAERAASTTVSEPVPATPMFGELIPSGDPQWYQGFRSPHYKSTHVEFRNKVRAFVEEVIDPHVEDWEKYAYYEHGDGPAPEKQVPHMELIKKAAEWGLLPATMGAKWPSEFTATPAPEDYDLFHSQILIEELGRPSSEVASIILTGMIIGLRSVMQFGLQRPELTQEVVSSCLAGDRQICLCMSEPYAGSDVAGLTARAELSADGTHYILNGEKKWITGGVYSDYFNVACRTDGDGAEGLSMLLVKREFGGVTTQKMDVTGWWASGTTYITFEDTKVPVEYVVGQAGNGFRQMMTNLNHERWFVSVMANRHARTALEEAMRYTQRRKTMGQTLIEHQAIRTKIAKMTMAVESSHQMVEHMTYQMIHMDEEEQRIMLAGMSALLKVQTCQTFEMCTREASQCMGGISYVRSGQGRKLETLLRTVRAFVIFAGSEEVMLDLGARQMVRLQRTLQDAGPAKVTMTAKV